MPNLDSPPFFDRLLAGEDGGRFSITPVTPFTAERCYRPGSNVLEQVFTTESGRARVTTSLNSGPSGRLPWSELAQRVEGLEGLVEFAVEVRPSRRLGQANPWREASQHGDVMHLDGILSALRASDGVERLTEADDRITARLATSVGSRSVLALLASSNEPLILPPLAAIDTRIDQSDQAWGGWSANPAYEGRYGDAVRRSALALKLLLFTPSGATAAAATASLPERVGGGKNYDYRFAWVRDVAYTIKAFLRVGAVEADLVRRARRPPGNCGAVRRLRPCARPHDPAPARGPRRPRRRPSALPRRRHLGIGADQALHHVEARLLDGA